ncbi:MAG: tRNA-uridine aminocarboxypropyltransferase [Aeromonas sp.]
MLPELKLPARHCPRCMRARKACLCAHLEPLDNPTPLIILQHPFEVAHPKGTAALLLASLSRVSLCVGEDFTADERLGRLLSDPSQRYALLWPDVQAQTLAEVKASGAVTGFILLDATWRKALRMLHVNPRLAALPRVSLTAGTGQYAIRKKPFARALSTLEAGYHLLSQWENNPHGYTPLLSAFAALNAQWLEFTARGQAARTARMDAEDQDES